MRAPLPATKRRRRKYRRLSTAGLQQASRASAGIAEKERSVADLSPVVTSESLSAELISDLLGSVLSFQVRPRFQKARDLTGGMVSCW